MSLHLAADPPAAGLLEYYLTKCLRDLGVELVDEHGPRKVSVTLADGTTFDDLWTRLDDDGVTDRWELHFERHDSVPAREIAAITIF